MTTVQIKVSASAGRFGIVGVPTFLARAQQLLHVGRNRLALDLHPLDRLGHTGGIPQLERSHFPVEAQLHGAIDLDHRVGNLANAIGGVGPQVGQCRPQEDVRLVLRRSQQRVDTLGQAVDGLRHLQRGKLRPARGTILQRLPVDGHDLALAIRLPGLAIEAALSLVAEPLALQHLREEAGQRQIAALVVQVRSGVANDVSQNIEPDQIGQAERRCLGPTDSRARQRVDVFDAEVHVLHQTHDVQDAEGADAISDEVGRVFGENHTLAQMQIAEVGDDIHRGRIGVGRGDQLQQPHVARRIEEVSAEPAAPEIFGEAFHDFRHGQAAGVGSDDGSGLADGFDLAQQSCA